MELIKIYDLEFKKIPDLPAWYYPLEGSIKIIIKKGGVEGYDATLIIDSQALIITDQTETTPKKALDALTHKITLAQGIFNIYFKKLIKKE